MDPLKKEKQVGKKKSGVSLKIEGQKVWSLRQSVESPNSGSLG